MFGTKIDGRTHSDRSHITCLLDRSEHHLIKLVWISKQLVVVDLYDKRYLMSILASDHSQYAKRRCHRVAATLHSDPHYILGVELHQIRRQTRTCGGF